MQWYSILYVTDLHDRRKKYIKANSYLQALQKFQVCTDLNNIVRIDIQMREEEFLE